MVMRDLNSRTRGDDGNKVSVVALPGEKHQFNVCHGGAATGDTRRRLAEKVTVIHTLSVCELFRWTQMRVIFCLTKILNPLHRT